MSEFIYVNINDFLSEADGEEEVRSLLSSFSCDKNKDVENFLKNNAINFAKKNQSITYLVFTNDASNLVGYFTLLVKPITIKAEKGFSNREKNKLERISELDEETSTYTLSAYLIAQLGKNFAVDKSLQISGTELMRTALDVIDEIRYAVGGLIVFVEAEENEKLLSFYTDGEHRFKLFGTRYTNGLSDECKLVQLLKIL